MRLDDTELLVYRGYVGKLMWLNANVQSDLNYIVLKLSNHTRYTMIEDLESIDMIVQRIKERDNVVKYSKVDDKEDLKVSCISDASYLVIEKLIGGNILLCSSTWNSKVCPLNCRSYTIETICNSTKDLEKRATHESVMTRVYTGERVEKILFGKVEGRILAEYATYF